MSFNVRDFGALGDGATDDTASIQAAIDACGAVGGGTVLFPAGIYQVSSTLKVTADYVNLVGETVGQPFTYGAGQGGSLIRTTSSFTGTSVIQVAQDSPSRYLDSNTVQGLSVNGWSTRVGGVSTVDGIYWMVTNGRIRDCFLSGMGHGIYTTGLGYGGVLAPYDCFIEDTKVQSVTGNGLSFLNNASDFRLTNVIVTSAGGHGVYFDDSAANVNAGPGTHLLGCYIYSCTGRAVYAQSPWQFEFTGCRFQECDGGIYLENRTAGFGGAGFKIVGCVFRDCSMAADGVSDGVNLNYQNAASGGIISGCTFIADNGLANGDHKRMRHAVSLENPNVQDVVVDIFSASHITGYTTTFTSLPVNDLGTRTVVNGAPDLNGQPFYKRANGILVVSGAGSPEGVVVAPPGSQYSRTNGGTTSSFYVKGSGTAATGWVAK